jgi:transcriptional regulator with XRE-family HTH domain
MPKRRAGDDNNALRDIRESKDLTQDQTATLVGVSRSTWSAWECRERPINISQLNRIQLALDIPDKDVDLIRKWWGIVD